MLTICDRNPIMNANMPAIPKKYPPLPNSDWKKDLKFGTNHKSPGKPVKEPKPRKPVKQISEKKKARLKEFGTEWEMFDAIWNERAHICEVCRWYIALKMTICFAHRLSKWRYPEHRYNKSNLSLVCSEFCHHALDAENAGNDQEILLSIV